jgi:hypothetical protein
MGWDGGVSRNSKTELANMADVVVMAGACVAGAAFCMGFLVALLVERRGEPLGMLVRLKTVSELNPAPEPQGPLHSLRRAA